MSARVLSRSSTGRTNRDAAGLEPPRTADPQQGRLKRPQLPRSSSRESGRGSNRSSSGSAHSKALGKPAGGANGVPVLPVTQREPSPDMRQRVAQDLADDFDRHCLIDKVYDKVYRSFEKSREAFRSFDPLGKGEIPVEEFLDAIGKKFCLSFSARERKLMREHLDKDKDGTINYKEFLDKFGQAHNVFVKAVKPTGGGRSRQNTESEARHSGRPRVKTSHASGSNAARSAAARDLTEEERQELQEQIHRNHTLVKKIRERIFNRGLRLARVFDHIDENGDGFLTASELKVGLKRMGFELSDSDLHFLVDFVDSGGETGGGMVGKHGDPHQHLIGADSFGVDRDHQDSVITYNEFVYAFEEPDYAWDYDPIGNSRRAEIAHYRAAKRATEPRKLTVKKQRHLSMGAELAQVQTPTPPMLGEEGVQAEQGDPGGVGDDGRGGSAVWGDAWASGHGSSGQAARDAVQEIDGRRTVQFGRDDVEGTRAGESRGEMASRGSCGSGPAGERSREWSRVPMSRQGSRSGQADGRQGERAMTAAMTGRSAQSDASSRDSFSQMVARRVHKVAPIYPGDRHGFVDGWVGRNAAVHDTFENVTVGKGSPWFADSLERFQTVNNHTLSLKHATHSAPSIHHNVQTGKTQYAATLERRRRNLARVNGWVQSQEHFKAARDTFNLIQKGQTKLKQLLYATGESDAQWLRGNGHSEA